MENRLPKPEMIEFIDIGGVSLLRAASKNYKDVVVLSDQKDYSETLKEQKENGKISADTRKTLAAKAFAHTAHYDSMIARFFREDLASKPAPAEPSQSSPAQKASFPSEFSIGLRKVSDLRYGENPQQSAALYRESGVREWGVACAEKLQGKELSFNNYLDLDAVWQVVHSFNLTHRNGDVCCAIVKHTNPCGAAIGKTPLESFQLAYNTDALSAFGGVIGLSSTVTKDLAESIIKSFFECIIAPDYEPAALEVFKAKPNLRILRQSAIFALPYELDLKKVSGGLLVQEIDATAGSQNIFSNVVSRRQPTPEELRSVDFAWKICQFVKSNAIVFSRSTVTVGIGSGQMSRIDSLRIAVQKMKERSTQFTAPVITSTPPPLVMASDAFFPFRDCVDEAAKVGATAIVQPGGSIRDQESIDAANEHNISMNFTGIRHFRH